MPDGTVQGTDKFQVKGSLYILTDHLYVNISDPYGMLPSCIVVLRDNVIIDGADHTLQGNGSGIGIYFRGVQNVTIKNFNLQGFSVGISTYVTQGFLPMSFLTKATSGCNFVNNTIRTLNDKGIFEPQSGWGVYLEFANNTLISHNIIKTQNPQKGIFVGSGFGGATYVNTTLIGNSFVGCGLYARTLSEIFAKENTIDGKPLIFLRGATNQVVNGAEQLFLYNCSNLTVKSIHPSANYLAAVQLEATNNSEITSSNGTLFLTKSSNNTIHGNFAGMIGLFSGSNYNRICENRFTAGNVIYPRAGSDYDYAKTTIEIFGSSYNDVYQNVLEKSNYGIWLDAIGFGNSQYNNIYGNKISDFDSGIYSSGTSDNNIYANNIANCKVGISLSSSSQFNIFQNNLTSYITGVSLWQSSYNLFYNNNFLANAQPVYIDHSMVMPPFYANSTNNMWDAGPPKGGNYWITYNGSDSDGDGIGNTPYLVFENETDHYPLMKPFSSKASADSPLPSPSAPALTVTPMPTSAATLTPIQSFSPSPTVSSASAQPSTAMPSLTTTPTPAVPEFPMCTVVFLAITLAVTAILHGSRKSSMKP